MIVAALKNTSLTAEEAMLKRQQAIQLKELQLQQEKEELRIRTEIAKVASEVFFSFFFPRRLNIST